MTDKEAAYILYKEGVKQEEIAETLKRSSVTISRWKKADNWDERATKDLMVEQTISEDIQQILLYQLQALKKKKEKFEAEGGEKLFGKGDLDGVRDLYNMVKSKETDFTQLVRIIRQINDYLKTNAPDIARQAAPYLNDFLNQYKNGGEQ